MKGSSVQNIRFDPNKQKLVNCSCGKQIVVGKFAKNDQKCTDCRLNNHNINTEEISNDSFSKKLLNICDKLGYQVTDKRTWMKKYPIDGGGIATIHIIPELPTSGNGPRIEYFSLVIQRAIGINENLRKFMPPDAAADCEVIANELGERTLLKPQLGQEKCDECGEYTNEFGVDSKRGKILCIRPNNCFKKHFTSSGAESLQ